MPDSNTTNGLPFPLPTGREVYDALMSSIEPDLLTDVIPTLDQKYSGESAEHRHERYVRYRLAYKKYDEAYKAWSAELNDAVTHTCKEALKTAEKKSAAQEANTLSELESNMLSA